MIIGPPLGSIIYAHTNYQWSFYVFGFLMMVNFMNCVAFIPNKINATSQLQMALNRSDKPANAGSFAGNISFDSEAIARLEKRRELQRQKKASERQALMQKHDNENCESDLPKRVKRRSSLQEREAELL